MERFVSWVISGKEGWPEGNAKTKSLIMLEALHHHGVSVFAVREHRTLQHHFDLKLRKDGVSRPRAVTNDPAVVSPGFPVDSICASMADDLRIHPHPNKALCLLEFSLGLFLGLVLRSCECNVRPPL